MIGLAADVAVQHADVQSGRIQPTEAQRQIFSHIAPGVADAVHMRQQFAVARDRMRLHGPGAENGEIRRRAPDRRPASQRIVIAVRDEDQNAALAQPLHAAHEAELRPDAAIGRIINIAREHDKGGLALNGHFHQSIERFERSVAQPSGDLG